MAARGTMFRPIGTAIQLPSVNSELREGNSAFPPPQPDTLGQAVGDVILFPELLAKNRRQPEPAGRYPNAAGRNALSPRACGWSRSASPASADGVASRI